MYTISYTDIVFDIDDIVHDIVNNGLPDVGYLKLRRADVHGRVPLIPCCLNANSVNTIPRSFRGKIPKEATADSRPDSGTPCLCRRDSHPVADRLTSAGQRVAARYASCGSRIIAGHGEKRLGRRG